MQQKDSKNWYAVRVISGSENKIKSAIDIGVVQRNLQELFGEVVLAKEIVNDKKRKKEVVKNLFPGYIFINMKLNSQTKDLITATTGVISFAGGNRTPIPMPPKEIDTILTNLAKLDSQQNGNEIVNLSVGDKVNISNSAFTGFVKSLDHNKNRVQVGVSVFDREVIMEVKPDQVKKVV